MNTGSVIVELDANNRITHVGADWDDMASSNGAPELTGQQVIGSHLLSHISGDTTRMFTEVMINAVRRKQEAVCIPYRCNTPTLKREMEMHLSPLPAGAIHMEHRTCRISPLAQPVSASSHVRCSMCNRLKTDTEEWRETIPAESSTTDTAPTAEPLTFIYTVCPDCRCAVRQRLNLPNFPQADSTAPTR